MNLLRYISRFAAATALLGLAACDSAIYDNEGDCDVTYRLRFVYDRNMKWADAFASQVSSVRVSAFTPDGQLVWTGSESGEALRADGYTMTLPLDAGNYRILAWCGLDGSQSFTLPAADLGGDITAHHCRLVRTTDGATDVSDRDLRPLYHGLADFELPASPDDGADYTFTLPLTKDTNTIRVVLQNMSGAPLDADDFTFAITDCNGHLGYHNNPVNTSEIVEYRAWAQYGGTTSINRADGEGGITAVSAVVAELTTSRLMAGSKARLTVTNRRTGATVASIPVVDYALLVKGNYNRAMTDQEYLDRQDEYNMTFFLDEGGNWLSASVIINSWHVVVNNADLNP